MDNEITKIKEGSTEFNSSIATLERMHDLMKSASLYSIEAANDYNSLKRWYATLKVLDREISPYLEEKEIKTLQPFRKIAIIDPRKYKAITNSSIINKIELYEALLRNYHANKGMGLIGKDTNKDNFFVPN